MFLLDKGEHFKRQAHFPDLTKVLSQKKKTDYFVTKANNVLGKEQIKVKSEKSCFLKGFCFGFCESMFSWNLANTDLQYQSAWTWENIIVMNCNIFFWYHIVQSLFFLLELNITSKE